MISFNFQSYLFFPPSSFLSFYIDLLSKHKNFFSFFIPFLDCLRNNHNRVCLLSFAVMSVIGRTQMRLLFFFLSCFVLFERYVGKRFHFHTYWYAHFHFVLTRVHAVPRSATHTACDRRDWQHLADRLEMNRQPFFFCFFWMGTFYFPFRIHRSVCARMYIQRTTSRNDTTELNLLHTPPYNSLLEFI